MRTLISHPGWLALQSCFLATVLLGGMLFLLCPMRAQSEEEVSKRLIHPLMPGIRSAEIWNTAWPRTLHDKQLTGFSPLVGDMKEAPRIWATIDVGGELSWIRKVKEHDGQESLLVNDGRLRLIDLAGKVRWTSDESGSPIFFGDLRGNGQDYLLLGRGPLLVVLNAATGKAEWKYRFEPPYVYLSGEVADLLPDRPGKEAAVFLAYGEEGCVINFPPSGEPEFVWRRTVVLRGEHPERFDHGCSIHLDLSVPDKPLIWNVRHHRCRGFDARTGEQVSELIYQIGGGHRRNYGPWAFGKGRDGSLLACVVAESVQQHVHSIRLNRNGPSELAWEHYYGEIYEVPGVAVQNIAVTDADGDGITEMIYNVKDPARDFRSFIHVRDAETGTVKAELPDRWCAAYLSELGEEKANGLLAFPAPVGATPDKGDLTVYRFTDSGGLKEMAAIRNACLWGPATFPAQQGNDLLIKQTREDGKASLIRYSLRAGHLEPVSRTEATSLLESPIQAAIPMPDGSPAFLAAGSQGRLEALTWQGKRRWGVPLIGGMPPTLSAADLNGDGRAELVAAATGHRVRVFRFDRKGKSKEIGNYEFLGPRNRHSPLLYDLEGNGQLCLIAPGSAADNRVAVRAYRGDGSLLWETPLDLSTSNQGMAVAWNAGQFLPGPHAAVAVSVANARNTIEATILLDGRIGKLLWRKGVYQEGSIVRPYRPMGIPGAFDIDGDGIEDIGMDMYSYMAFLRGIDGSFAYLRHTRNIREEGALYAGMLYNSYTPIYKDPGDEKPHWFVPLGHGIIGLMKPDPREGIWKEDLGYDVPPKIGMVDADGDGVMEIGYAAQNDSAFLCRNLWTGEEKWKVSLPSAPNSPVITADVDGDGKGEFLVGSYCIGTDSSGKGEIRWESPVPLGWAIIADFDGDGKGEIACAWRGKIYILK